FPQLYVDAADILLFNPYMQTLEYAVGRGFHTSAIQRTQVRLGEGCCGRAAVERRPIFIHNLREESGVRSKQLSMEESFVSYYAAPLIAKGQVNGVLEVFHRAPFAPDQEWLGFLEMLAGQAAIAIDSIGLFEGLQHANTELVQAYDATIEGWSHALDLRDKETEGHSLRVTEMTVLMAIAMGISKNELIHVRRGALLHDIGKMGVPDNILLKVEPLTDEEWIIMRKHPVYAYELLSHIAYLRPALDIPYCHHEKWDGTGYPSGLKGESIPLAARIFAVVDVWDAMRSDRPYRKGWVEEKVREHIKSLAGTHLDPKVVEVFLKMKW
ncbi:MAG: HD domain-containing protein, partial [Candidatus Brocadiaceae bacterium]|nr:HD domain-containing protein [Candidatus Brocadiaceae bacterium]